MPRLVTDGSLLQQTTDGAAVDLRVASPGGAAGWRGVARPAARERCSTSTGGAPGCRGDQAEISAAQLQGREGPTEETGVYACMRACMHACVHACVHVFLLSSSSAFSLLGVGASSFHYPCSPVLSFFSPSSMFSLLHLRLSFSPHVLTISVFHVLITTSSSVFLSTCPNHLSLPCSHYYIFVCLSLHMS